MTTREFDMEKALADPKAVFDTPERLLSRTDLDSETKLQILRRWSQDAESLARAEYEGMEGDGASLLRRVKLAIDELEAA